MSLYQSEMLARMPYLQPMIREIGEVEAVRRRIPELPKHTGPNRHPYPARSYCQSDAGCAYRHT